MSTCNRSDLQTLGSPPVMPKTLPITVMHLVGWQSVFFFPDNLHVEGKGLVVDPCPIYSKLRIITSVAPKWM